MQSYMQARPIQGARRNAAALSAAIAVCLSLAFPVSGYASGDKVQSKAIGGDLSQKQKLVVQVSDGDPKTWNQALNNMKNVQRALGKDKVDIELVVYGHGIGMLKMESVVGNRVDEAVANGVTVVACEETMQGQKLTKGDMLKSIGYVPGGVIELMTKQQQGYAYIRP